MFKIASQAPPTWEKVEFEGGSFEIACRQPSYEDLLLDHGYVLASYEADTRAQVLASNIQMRMEKVFTNWRDVNDQGGRPLPFTPENLKLAAGSSLTIFRRLAELAAIYFNRTPASLGNSDAPLKDSSPAEEATSPA